MIEIWLVGLIILILAAYIIQGFQGYDPESSLVGTLGAVVIYSLMWTLYYLIAYLRGHL